MPGRVGRVSNESVLKCTRKGWDEWIAILDQAGARGWSHGEIAAFLKSRYKLRPWWQQGVATGYEIATGRREEGQSTKGLYTTTATKSLHHDARSVWKFLLSKKGKALWLRPLFEVAIEPGASFETEDGFYGEVRTLLPGRRIRLSWREPEREKPMFVHVTVVPRPKARSILVVDHGQIRDQRTKAALSARWRAALDGLAEAMGERGA